VGVTDVFMGGGDVTTCGRRRRVELVGDGAWVAD
jgi:hypothetical protein